METHFFGCALPLFHWSPASPFSNLQLSLEIKSGNSASTFPTPVVWLWMLIIDQMMWAHFHSSVSLRNASGILVLEGIITTDFLHSGMGLFLSLKNLISIVLGKHYERIKELISIGIVWTGKKSKLFATSLLGYLKDRKRQLHLIFQPIRKTVMTSFWKWNSNLPTAEIHW